MNISFYLFSETYQSTTKLELALAHDRSHTSPYKDVVRNTIVPFV